MFKHYLITAWRNLLKYKVQSIIAIAGLAFGLFCFTLTTYSTRMIMEPNRGIPNHERFMQVMNEDSATSRRSLGSSCYAADEIMELEIPGIELACYNSIPIENNFILNIDGNEQSFVLKGTNVDSAFAKLFSLKVLWGSWEDAATHPYSVVLPRSFAEMLFGEGNIYKAIGMQLRRQSEYIDIACDIYAVTSGSFSEAREAVYTVRAVVEDLPPYNSVSFFEPLHLYLLNDIPALQFSNNHPMKANLTTILLSAGADKEKVKEILRQRTTTAMQQRDEAYTLSEVKVVDHEYDTIKEEIAPIAGTIGLLVILICLLNLFSLLTGSWLNRTREFSLRKVLGGGTVHGFGLLATQSLLLLAVAAVAALLIREIFMPKQLLLFSDVSIVIKGGELIVHLLQYLGGIALSTLVLCAIVSGYIQHTLAQKQLARHTKSRVLRSIILTVQFIICWIFFSFAIAMQMQSSAYASQVFSTLSGEEKQSIFRIEWADYMVDDAGMCNALTQEVSQINGIEEVIGTEWLGINTSLWAQLGEKESGSGFMPCIIADTALARFIHLNISEGRNYRNNEEIIINRHAADKYGWKVGQQLYTGINRVTVCGIYESCVNRPPSNDELSDCQYIREKRYTSQVKVVLIKAKKGEGKKVHEALNSLLNERMPASITNGGKLNIPNLAQEIENKSSIELHYRSTILFISVVCLIITLMGVYAAISLDTERRRKEMAIRKINGARPWQIALLFIKQYALLLVISFAIVLPALLYAFKLWDEMFTLLIGHGILFWCLIFVTVALLTAATLFAKIYCIAKENPAEVVKRQ